MEKDWTLVYTVYKSYQAELCLELLEEQQITGVVINKRDTSYTSFGEYEIYVPEEKSDQARTLLQKSGI
jgi:hypothetical protein